MLSLGCKFNSGRVPAQMRKRGAWSFPGLVIAAAVLAACAQPVPTTTTTNTNTATTPANAGNQTPSTAATAAPKPAATSAGQTAEGMLRVTLGDLGAESYDVIIPQVNNVIVLIY